MVITRIAIPKRKFFTILCSRQTSEIGEIDLAFLPNLEFPNLLFCPPVMHELTAFIVVPRATYDTHRAENLPNFPHICVHTP